MDQFCYPVDGAQRRAGLLSAAAIASPRLGGEILPHLLQPLQEHRYTAQQLLEALTPTLELPYYALPVGDGWRRKPVSFHGGGEDSPTPGAPWRLPAVSFSARYDRNTESTRPGGAGGSGGGAPPARGNSPTTSTVANGAGAGSPCNGNATLSETDAGDTLARACTSLAAGAYFFAPLFVGLCVGVAAGSLSAPAAERSIDAPSALNETRGDSASSHAISGGLAFEAVTHKPGQVILPGQVASRALDTLRAVQRLRVLYDDSAKTEGSSMDVVPALAFGGEALGILRRLFEEEDEHLLQGGQTNRAATAASVPKTLSGVSADAILVEQRDLAHRAQMVLVDAVIGQEQVSEIIATNQDESTFGKQGVVDGSHHTDAIHESPRSNPLRRSVEDSLVVTLGLKSLRDKKTREASEAAATLAVLRADDDVLQSKLRAVALPLQQQDPEVLFVDAANQAPAPASANYRAVPSQDESTLGAQGAAHDGSKKKPLNSNIDNCALEKFIAKSLTDEKASAAAAAPAPSTAVCVDGDALQSMLHPGATIEASPAAVKRLAQQRDRDATNKAHARVPANQTPVQHQDESILGEQVAVHGDHHTDALNEVPKRQPPSTSNTEDHLLLAFAVKSLRDKKAREGAEAAAKLAALRADDDVLQSKLRVGALSTLLFGADANEKVSEAASLTQADMNRQASPKQTVVSAGHQRFINGESEFDAERAAMLVRMDNEAIPKEAMSEGPAFRTEPPGTPSTQLACSICGKQRGNSATRCKGCGGNKSAPPPTRPVARASSRATGGSLDPTALESVGLVASVYPELPLDVKVDARLTPLSQILARTSMSPAQSGGSQNQKYTDTANTARRPNISLPSVAEIMSTHEKEMCAWPWLPPATRIFLSGRHTAGAPSLGAGANAFPELFPPSAVLNSTLPAASGNTVNKTPTAAQLAAVACGSSDVAAALSDQNRGATPLKNWLASVSHLSVPSQDNWPQQRSGTGVLVGFYEDNSVWDDLVPRRWSISQRDRDADTVPSLTNAVNWLGNGSGASGLFQIPAEDADSRGERKSTDTAALGILGGADFGSSGVPQSMADRAPLPLQRQSTTQGARWN
jgi:hypothetical protein